MTTAEFLSLRKRGGPEEKIKRLVANPQQRLADLPIVTESERQQLLVEWNDTKTELFEAQVPLRYSPLPLALCA